MRYSTTLWLASMPKKPFHADYEGPKVPPLTAISMYGCCNATGRFLEFLSLSTKQPHLWIIGYAAKKRAIIGRTLRQLTNMKHHQTPEFANLRRIFMKSVFPSKMPHHRRTPLAVTWRHPQDPP